MWRTREKQGSRGGTQSTREEEIGRVREEEKEEEKANIRHGTSSQSNHKTTSEEKKNFLTHSQSCTDPSPTTTNRASHDHTQRRPSPVSPAPRPHLATHGYCCPPRPRPPSLSHAQNHARHAHRLMSSGASCPGVVSFARRPCRSHTSLTSTPPDSFLSRQPCMKLRSRRCFPGL